MLTSPLPFVKCFKLHVEYYSIQYNIPYTNLSSMPRTDTHSLSHTHTSAGSVLTVVVICVWCLSIVALAGMQLFMCPARPHSVLGKCAYKVFPPAAATAGHADTDSGASAASSAAAYAAGLVNSSSSFGTLDEAEQECGVYSPNCLHHEDCPLFRFSAFEPPRNFCLFKSVCLIGP